MEDTVTANRAREMRDVAARMIKHILLLCVWALFLGSNYLTITHLVAWYKTDRWPSYSTASLLSDVDIAGPAEIGHIAQPALNWIMAAPAAYSLMGLAIVLSVSMTLLPDN